MNIYDYATKLKEYVLDSYLQPRPDGTTFCNLFVHLVSSELFGFKGFSGLMANDMVSLMEKTGSGFKRFGNSQSDYSLIAQWVSENPSMLIIAGQKAKGHGHICVVYPSKTLVTSGKWKKDVPVVANVGKTNFYGKGLNWAFATEPSLYLYQGDVNA